MLHRIREAVNEEVDRFLDLATGPHWPALKRSLTHAVAEALKTDFPDLEIAEDAFQSVYALAWEHDNYGAREAKLQVNDVLDEVRRHRRAHLELVEDGVISAGRSAELLNISMSEWRRIIERK